MATEKTTFEFPDEIEAKGQEVEIESEPEIEVVDDTPEPDKNRSLLRTSPADVTDDELSKYSDQKLKDRLAHLGKGYHEERRAKEAAFREREEAMRVAHSAVEENRRLQGSLSNNQNTLLEQSKRIVASEVEEAKREYRAAYESGDADGVIAAQSKLTAASIREERVQNYRPAPVQTEQNVVQTPQPTRQAPTMDAKTRDWQEQNPWFGGNRKMTAYALSLHEDLVDSGVKVSSDEYYNNIDADMKKRFPESFAEEPAEAKSSQRTKSNVVAPASRSTAPRKVVLTQTQVNIAKRLGVPLELYARKVAEEMRKS
jgi:hypothetical protein